MAITTTINPDSDTWLNEGQPTNNYGTASQMQCGLAGGTLNEKNMLIQFDVSAYTKPSDIVKAELTLTAASSGSGTNTMTLARLSQTYVESSCNWNTYDGSNTWVTGGSVDAEITEPIYTFGVGTTTDVVLDITSLVVDAINRRSGILRLIGFFNGTPASGGFTRFYSREDSTSGNRPLLSITVAHRISWEGGLSGDLEDARNWSSGLPTANDIALFNENGSFSPSTGAMVCSRCYFGKNYSQDFGSSTTSLTITASKVFANTKAQLFLRLLVDDFYIRGAKQIKDGCVLSGTIGNVYITNCESELRIEATSAISNIYIMSGNRINPASNTSTGIVSQVIIEDGSDDSNILCEGRFNVTDNGENDDIFLYGGGKYELNNTSEVDGIENLTIASDSVCYFNSKEIQTALTMYGGTFTIEKNMNAQLDMPTTIDLFASDFNLYNGLDSANATAFSGTTFTSYSGRITMGQSAKITLTG